MTEELEKLFDNDLTPPTPNNAICIDGVDVSDCRLRQYNSDLCNGFKMDNSGFHQGHCRQNPNCYYKQLKRLEQENKELKEYSQRMENQRENYYKEYNKLRSALEEIRILATKNVSIENFVKIQNKINEVLR